MIRLTSADDCLATAVTLARPYLVGEPTAANIKLALRDMLSDRQGQIPRYGQLEPHWLLRGEERARLTGIFNTRTALDDRNYERLGEQEPSVAEQALLLAAQKSLMSLGELDDTFRELFELAVFTVFWAPATSNAGGTTSAAVGVLWMSPKAHWSQRDYYEFYLHELAHTLLFLDEYRRGLFVDRRALIAPENHAMSAIRRTTRPLDKVLHSAVVASEVLLARDELLGHPDAAGLHPQSDELAAGIAESVSSMRTSRAARELLTPRAWELVDECDRALEVFHGSLAG